jgi:hypothetical protein
MGSAFKSGRSLPADAKEYSRFCRIHGLFLVDGLERWRTALKSRGLSEEEISAKISAAADFIRRIGEPPSERQGA